MNKEIIKDELHWLLEAINEQFEAIRQYEEKIPHIEFDLLMENVRKMHESMQVLKRINDELHAGGASRPVREQGSRTTQDQEHRGTPDETPVMPAVTIRFDRPEGVEARVEVSPPPVVKTETAPEPPQKELPFKPIAREVKKEPVRKARKPESMDLFSAGEPAFSIKLKEAREKTFGPKIPSERIDNLKSAITINDKFMFINELFEGNLREYNETIETLNGFRTLDQAAEFLDLVKRKNFWDTGSNAFAKLKELVERRF